MKSQLDIKSILEWIKNPKNKVVSKFIFIFTLGLLLMSLSKMFSDTNYKHAKTTLKSYNKFPVSQ